MVYRVFRKFRNVICFVVMICIMVPIISACGISENKLSKSKNNVLVGYGANIEAYTTYSQAQFMEMDQDMYYSYLMSGRDFILVVLPGICQEDGCYPDKENLMFQATYTGVTPYAQELVNGNLSFSVPEYKILIYYVVAEEFLSWERDASDEMEASFVGSALDFLGPSDLDNYSFDGKDGLGVNVVQNKYEYNLKNVVNNNRYVSECDFLPVDESYNFTGDRPAKCSGFEQKNVVANVAKGDSEGITMLYSGGGLSGYFTYDQVNQYNLKNVGWIGNILKGRTVENYFIELLNELNSDIFKGSLTNEVSTYVSQMAFKLRYDLALLGRIKKINYNTFLDINTGSSITGLNGSIKDADKYNELLKGTTQYNNGDYIAFTTSDGFIFDRGNVVMEAGEDFLFNTNYLEQLTIMDACSNRSLASYAAEALATYGIVAGGIAVGVGAVAVAAYAAGAMASTLVSTATLGLASLSVPGPGWIIGGIILLAVGAAALYYGISTKKAINDTNSANFCKVYEEAVQEIINISYVKVPIYNYNIPKDENYSVELCYSDYVLDPDDGREKCGTLENQKFVPSKQVVPAFRLADVKQVETLDSLSGSPSIRLYSKGRFVDEIYGAASPQFVYAIMDSWGVTAASSMKFYTGMSGHQNSNDEFVADYFDVYDLLAGSERSTYISNASYCFSTKYGQSCSLANSNSRGPLTLNRDYENFKNGAYKIPLSSVASKYEGEVNRIKGEISSKAVRPDLDPYVDVLTDLSNYSQIDVSLENNTYYANLNGYKYSINKNGDNIYLLYGDDMINVKDGIFVFRGINFKIRETTAGYIIECCEENFANIINNLKKVFNGNANIIIDDFANSYTLASDTEKRELANSLKDVLKGATYYYESIPMYFTVSVIEKPKQNGDAKESETSSSVLYKTAQIELKY